MQIPYSHDRFSKISTTFFVKKLIPYKTYVREDRLSLALYGSTTIQSRLFLKSIEIFVWFPKQYLLGFFLLEKQLANIPDRGFLFLHNTLLLYSLSPFWLIELQTKIQIHSLHVGWRNFFPVVLLCQFLVLAGNRFWFYLLCTYVLRVQYSCGVVLVFLGSGGK